MGDRDKILVAYIMSQQVVMDLFFILLVLLSSMYLFMESFEIGQEEENFEAENAVGNDSDSDASSLSQTLLTVTPRKQLSQKMRRRREILNSGVTEMQTLVTTLLKMSAEMDRLLCQFSCDHDAPERRRRVNEELMKLPGLSVRDRLRAATLLVSDMSRLNLFSCFPEDKKLGFVRHLLENEQKS